MPVDVGGLDPLSVSLRDYIDHLHAQHAREQERERAVLDTFRDSVLRATSDLEERIEQRFNLNDKALIASLSAQEKAVAAALQAAKEATLKAERDAEQRFASVNEFRGQLTDQAATFMPRELADSQFEDVRKQVSSLTSRIDQKQGVDQGANIERRLAAIATQIDNNTKSIIGGEGAKKGGDDRLSAVYALLAILLSVGSLIVVLTR